MRSKSQLPTEPEESPMSRDLEIARIRKDWTENPRWKGVRRGYAPEDVYRLRGSVTVEHTLARRGAEKLWRLMQERAFVNSLGALTGNQAMQQVRAGLQGDLPLAAGRSRPTPTRRRHVSRPEPLPANSVPDRRAAASTRALQRADQIDHAEGGDEHRLVRAHRRRRRGRLRRRR